MKMLTLTDLVFANSICSSAAVTHSHNTVQSNREANGGKGRQREAKGGRERQREKGGRGRQREAEGGKEAGRQGGREARRQGGKEAGRQGGREARRQREAGRQGGSERPSASNHNLVHPLRTRETWKKKKRKKKEEKERCCSYEQIYRTMGLISADRSNKATLLLTIPRSIKVVCNGFISSNI
jgi:hypothetical protein